MSHMNILYNPVSTIRVYVAQWLECKLIPDIITTLSHSKKDPYPTHKGSSAVQGGGRGIV